MEASHPLGYGLVVRYLVFTTEITQVRILDLLDKKGCVKLLDPFDDTSLDSGIPDEMQLV